MSVPYLKQAQPGAPIGAQLVAALLGMGLAAADSAHVAELKEEAAIMNEALRAHEASRMRQTTSMLDRKYASAERELLDAVKVAAAISVAQDDMDKLAYLLERQGMDKEAIGAILGGLARGAGAALKGLGGAASAAARLKIPGTPAAPPLLQRAGAWVGRQGAAAQKAGTRLSSVAPSAATPAAGGKPFLSAATKGKLLAGGALAGVGYTGMKGMQAARDYMMAPTGAYHGAPIQHEVNQFGYAQY